jgi:coiled-coil domain-containing protein 55
MKVSFALNKSKPATSAPPSTLAKPTAFSAADDDEPATEPLTLGGKGKKGSDRPPVISKQAKKRMAAEMELDSSVYEYDEVWDNMQQVKQKQKELKERDSQERKVCNGRHWGNNCLHMHITFFLIAKIHV